MIVRAREILENLEENAIADAGMPSYTRERHAKFHVKKMRKNATPETEDDEPEQPTLF